MKKFKNINVGDEIYSVVFGLGKVVFVLAKSLRLDGYYAFEVLYENGQRTYYTEDGRPGWCKDLNNCKSTILYKNEVDFNSLDTKIEKNILKRHQIDRLRYENILEMMSPAGAWVEASLMPDAMVENAIQNGEYHLFRKMRDVKLAV